jgi:hypothetical protein
MKMNQQKIWKFVRWSVCKAQLLDFLLDADDIVIVDNVVTFADVVIFVDDNVAVFFDDNVVVFPENFVVSVDNFVVFVVEEKWISRLHELRNFIPFEKPV